MRGIEIGIGGGMTKLYVQDKHRTDMKAAVNQLVKAVDHELSVQLLPKTSVVNARVMVAATNRPFALLSIKCRRTQFADYQLSARKVRECQEISRSTGVPYALLVRVEKRLWWRWMPPEEELVEQMGGRTDRNDPNDLEMMACFSWNSFHEVLWEPKPGVCYHPGKTVIASCGEGRVQRCPDCRANRIYTAATEGWTDWYGPGPNAPDWWIALMGKMRRLMEDRPMGSGGGES